jgi:uncharacterized membrane protein
MARPQVADGGNGLQIWRVVANIYVYIYICLTFSSCLTSFISCVLGLVVYFRSCGFFS